MKADHEKQINYILTEQRNGLERNDILQKFAKTFKLSDRTFDNRLKIAKERFYVESESIRKANENILIDGDANALKSGLKSKTERQLSLQNQVDEIQKILDDGETPDTIIDIKSASSFDINRKITAIERSQLMKTLRELTAELNKMDGSYAPAKLDHTTNGKDLPQTTIQIGYGPKRKD